MATKISYRTVTLERPLPVPRARAWTALVDATSARTSGVDLGAPLGSVIEVVISDEPPWRRVARLDGDHPSALVQTTFTIRDDGDRCLVAWSCLVDPTDVDPATLDTLVDVVADDGAAQLDRIVASACGSP